MKERIIGAAVLVIVVVLIVPVFLDGPPTADEIVSTAVPLPGQSEQKTQTVVLERDRKEPVPLATGKEDAAQPTPQTAPPAEARPVVADPPAQKQAEQTPAPTKAATAAPQQAVAAAADSISSTGMWAVQLGSFSDQKNAERQAAELRKQGFAAFLSQVSTSSGQMHRVRVGPQKDRESADAMAARLAKAGHKGQVLPHP